MAVVQNLPSGWEIENIRLMGESYPHWSRNYRLNYEEYTDIRDDKIMWFFDFNSYNSSVDFMFKVNAVTLGEFYLPPTLAEAMYNNAYSATKAGQKVKVIK